MQPVRFPIPACSNPLFVLAAMALAMGATGCSSSDKPKDKRPPEVGFAVMQATSVPLDTELAGRTSASRIAEVRPQVSGIIQRRLFAEGALIRQGQPLYQIEPSLYRAATAQAAANLASAMASAEATRAKADRYRPLATEQAVSQQDYTDAAAAARVAAASVAQTRAALGTARINLRYTTVPAPISGHIGRSLVTEGALATASQTTPLAVISVLDPIYVDIQQSSADMLRLRRLLANGNADARPAQVRLKLDDGTIYPLAGTLEFAEVTVDPATGTVNLRARFPNPDGLLLPGLFVRTTLTQAVQNQVFLVPQGALSRDPRGNATVLVVGAGNKAEIRKVTADRTLGAAWVVTQGLKAGDRVITQGLGKAKPGQPVRPVPDSTPQRPLVKAG